MLPEWLRGQTDLGFIRYRTYSLAIIAAGVLLALALWLGFERTRIGASIRAAVDNRRMAESLGVDVGRLFTLTFALGGGLAAVGAGLGAEILGLDPQYPLRYLIYFLIVVAVGGLGRVTGVFFAAAAHRHPRLRAQDPVPEGRHDVHLRAHPGAAAVAAAGPLRPARRMTAPGPGLAAARALAERHRVRWWEAAPWLAGIALFFLLPSYLAFGTQLVITILFALSLDLVLGYAGIVTLGHAAFFGAGAYTVGMLAAHCGLERAAQRARGGRAGRGSNRACQRLRAAAHRRA